MLSCNFVGVVFARSLHFQFYCWYWHAMPFLLWRADGLPLVVKVAVMAALEVRGVNSCGVVCVCVYVYICTVYVARVCPLALCSFQSSSPYSTHAIHLPYTLCTMHLLTHTLPLPAPAPPLRLPTPLTTCHTCDYTPHTPTAHAYLHTTAVRSFQVHVELSFGSCRRDVHASVVRRTASRPCDHPRRCPVYDDGETAEGGMTLEVRF